MRIFLGILPFLRGVGLARFGLCVMIFVGGAMSATKADDSSSGSMAEKIVCDYPDDLDALPSMAGVKTLELYHADGTTPEHIGAYSHHPHVFAHAGILYAAWSNHLRDEDGPGQRILFRRSADRGETWQPPLDEPPAILFPSLDSWGFDDDESLSKDDRVGTSNGFAVVDGALYAINEVLPSIVCQQAGVGRLVRRIHDDGTLGEIFWLEETAPSLPENVGFYPDFSNPKYREIGQKIDAYLNDAARRHLPSWDFKGARNTTTEIEAGNVGSPSDRHRLCEPTPAVETSDGRLLQFWRDLGTLEQGKSSLRLYVGFSRDGQHWSVPERSTILNCSSRPNALNLPDGRIVLINNPKSRQHLVLSVSADGYKFDRSWLLRKISTSERFKGFYKGGYAAAYQHSCLVGNSLAVIYSVNKEDIELTILPFTSLE